MLALKAIMAGRNEVKVMIFDEIDAGIGGRMAQVVGEKMASLGAGMQVIAVSHLPQIAALADAHYLVEKTVANNRTGTSVRRLNERERVNELARMVGGAGGMDSGLAHAANMLAEARKWKLSAVTCGQACP
jgi:DNA repair protein RecN (Recombination protein N)